MMKDLMEQNMRNKLTLALGALGFSSVLFFLV